jgi:DedD protein
VNQQVKTRLVGAIVLVSLAVIFIPILLDGQDGERSPLAEQFVPERPGYHFEPLGIPLRPLPPVAEGHPRVVDPADLEPYERLAPDGDDPVAARPETPAPSSPATAVSPAPSPAKPASSTPSKPSSPLTSPPSSEQTLAWVVQVGSFSQQGNALALRDRLRQQGFSAFVDRASTGAGSTWRVRVGPELRRENAETLQQRLKNELKIEGIVVGHGS